MADKPSLPPKAKHYTNLSELIGRGISTWAVMEMSLVQIAGKLLGTTNAKAGLVLYSINTFYSCITIIDGLFAQDRQFAAEKEKWTGLTSELKRLNDVRVRLAHQAVFVEFHETIEGDIVTTSGGLQPSPFDSRPKQKGLKPLSSGEIEQFMTDVGALIDKLRMFGVDPAAF
jgi:hypothetical protein